MSEPGPITIEGVEVSDLFPDLPIIVHFDRDLSPAEKATVQDHPNLLQFRSGDTSWISVDSWLDDRTAQGATGTDVDIGDTWEYITHPNDWLNVPAPQNGIVFGI